MYLSNIKLWNFRKYGSDSFNLQKPDLDLDFTDSLNVLIGENDSGKSAIIDAIKLVLKTHSYEWIRAEEDDFYKNQDRFRIELFFEDLKSEEAKHFIEWLGWNGEGEEAKPYLRLVYDVTRNKERILPSDVKAGADDIGYPLNAEAREYLKITYLRPLRDAEHELIPRKNSRLSQILQGHEAFVNKDNHYLLDHYMKLNKSIEHYFLGQDETGNEVDEAEPGKRIKSEIDNHIRTFYDATKESEYTTQDVTVKHILEKLELSIKDIQNPGLGTLNRLFMAAELLHLNKNNWDGLRLGLIEELEAHLHPQAQMKVIEALQEQKGIQLILTTHSPNLASKVKLENLIICEDKNVFPMGREYTQLDPDNYAFLERFLDVTKSNLFFAKGVVLVEGWAEEILLPPIAKAIGYDLTRHEVSIVNIGNTGFKHYAKIFLRNNAQAMKIPVSIITDIDVREYELSYDGKISKVEEEKIKQSIEKNIGNYSAALPATV